MVMLSIILLSLLSVSLLSVSCSRDCGEVVVGGDDGGNGRAR